MKLLETLKEIQKEVDERHRCKGRTLMYHFWNEMLVRTSFPEQYKGQEANNRFIYEIVHSHVKPTDKQVELLMESQLWISKLILALNKLISEDVIRRIHQQIPKHLLCSIPEAIEMAIAENPQTPDDILEALAQGISYEVVSKISERDNLSVRVAGIVKEREKAEWQMRKESRKEDLLACGEVEFIESGRY